MATGGSRDCAHFRIDHGEVDASGSSFSAAPDLSISAVRVETGLAAEVDGFDGQVGSRWNGISNLVSLAYEASLDISGWPAFLEAYVQAVGGSRGLLILNSGPERGATLVRWWNWCEEDARVYAAEYVGFELGRASKIGRREDSIRATDLSSPAADWQPSTVCRELLRSRDVRYQLSGIFATSTGRFSVALATRREKEGPFLEPAFAIASDLLPHLHRAVLLHNELFSLRVRLGGLAVHLDRCPSPFLVTDTCGKIIYANPAAHEVTAAKDGLLVKSGYFSLISPKDQAAFVRALEGVTRQRGPFFQRLEVKRRSRKAPYLLLLTPVVHTDSAPNGSAQPTASVLIIDRDARPELDSAILAEIFSLTPAEARVTAQLAGGRSAEEIAGEMEISLETVRTHIRRILSKTNTVRQGELISLVLRAAPFRSA